MVYENIKTLIDKELPIFALGSLCIISNHVMKENTKDAAKLDFPCMCISIR